MDEITKKVIGTRINTALALRNVKQKDLAKHLEVSDNTISYFVGGSRTPNMEQLIKISKFLNVSTDYLLGLTKTASADTKIKDICEYTGLDEQAVETLHEASEPIIICPDEEFLDEDARQVIDDMKIRAKFEISEQFKFINYFFSSGIFYEAASSITDYYKSVSYTTHEMEKTLDIISNGNLSPNKINEEINSVISEIDRLFYFEAIENLGNIVTSYCKEMTDRYKKIKGKLSYLQNSVSPIIVYPEKNDIKFGNLTHFDLRLLSDAEMNELEAIVEILKKYYLDVRAGKEGETNANNNETE